MKNIALAKSGYLVLLQEKPRGEKAILISLLNKANRICSFWDPSRPDLENELGCKVDIVRICKGMNAFLKDRIDREAIYV